MFTVVALVLVAFAWDALFLTLRSGACRLLWWATLGANTDRAQTLARQYVLVDHWALALQSLSGVFRGGAERTPSPAFTQRVRGGRLAGLVFSGVAVVRVLLLIPKWLISTVPGVLSVIATWWVLGHPGLREATNTLQDWQRNGALSLGAANLTAIGVVVAVLGFVLSRLSGAIAAGHRAWRRSEAAKASNELAQREVAIAKLLSTLDEVGWALHVTWESWLRDAEDDAKAHIAEAENKLRQLLDLPIPMRPFGSYPRRWPIEGPSPSEAAAKKAQEAVATMWAYLEDQNQRSKARMRRYVPWRVYRKIGPIRMRRSLRWIELYVEPWDASDPYLTPPDWFTDLHAEHDTTSPDGHTPEVTKATALKKANAEWQRQADEHQRELVELAHRALVDALVGIAQLETAQDAIASYVYPTGWTKFLDWMRPA